MRALADASRIRELMRALGKAARQPTSVYLTGGATAVLTGWRGMTVDVDLRLEPDHELLRAIEELKQRLDINVELASPEDFVPVASDWRARSPFIERMGHVSFHHFDLHAQALSKVERGHDQDVADVNAMLERGLVNAASIWAYYDRVKGELFRYPALDRSALERAIERAFGLRP
ncbi:MAG: hypothetical protein FJ207_03620 [Gemmatimonadetes bacterium]|nr:hypothetical protein [Gemmatimonadota bacterium]